MRRVLGNSFLKSNDNRDLPCSFPASIQNPKLVPDSDPGSKIQNFIVSFLGLLMLASVAFAEETEVRIYPLPGHGRLELAVPAAWQEEVRRPPYNLPPTIMLRPSEGDAFLAMITPLWNLADLDDFNSDKAVKEAVELDMKETAVGAAEEELLIERIEGPRAYGYYFLASDKAPKPGEWKYALKGGVAAGDLLLSVTVLTREKDSPVFAEALEMLRSAKHRK
jgi:hypothetical protein